mmetsp:Transcript_41788/g.65271  ORF Transcript_41788/g.65271 Transcript_41788/m.65271 type:complete len:207 (-) Transcript_41788:477-1097(-)
MIGKLPGFYYKIPVIESALKDYETVVWLDMDGSTPSPVGAPRGPRDCVPFTTCFEENIQFVFPLFRPRSDPRQVHPGSAFMIFRNGSYTRRILHGAWASAEAGRFHKSGDQLAILDQVFTILGEENTEFVYTEGQCVAMDGTDNCFLKVSRLGISGMHKLSYGCVSTGRTAGIGGPGSWSYRAFNLASNAGLVRDYASGRQLLLGL